LDNITATGAGVLNIDAARIGTEEIPSNQWTDNAHPFGGGAGNEYKTVVNKGRWPANFILMDKESAAALDKQSGNLKSGDILMQHNITGGKPPIGTFAIRDRTGESEFLGDFGPALP